MRAAPLLLALCLGAVLVNADVELPPASCGPANTPGGWTATQSNVTDALLVSILDEVEVRYGGNLTALLGGGNFCPNDDPNYQAQGCQQVVQGTNYKLWINITCSTADGGNQTIGISMDAYQPLPVNTTMTTASSLRIDDLDVDFVAVNGAIVGDGDDLDDGPDRWEYNATTRGIVAGAAWSNEDDDDDGDSDKDGSRNVDDNDDDNDGVDDDNDDDNDGNDNDNDNDNNNDNDNDNNDDGDDDDNAARQPVGNPNTGGAAVQGNDDADNDNGR